jgi:Tol biopolymer transport system component
VQTGEAEPFPAFWDVGAPLLIDPSPDGKKIFYSKERRIAVMDLETGVETLLHADEPASGATLSPDGRHLAFAVRQNDTHRLLVMPATGGEPRELYRYETEKATPYNLAWSRDGASVLYTMRTGDTYQLWRVSVAGGGGAPQKLDLAMESLQYLRVHPDGRRIAFDAGSGGAEVWVMEKFLPSE